MNEEKEMRNIQLFNHSRPNLENERDRSARMTPLDLRNSIDPAGPFGSQTGEKDTGNVKK